ncbi:hypothetical protein EQM14_01880 [Caproiciproducens sp. NJN-50]|uniref:hypothetical protein n=1 Tax=Acutalibacteraceae TaxID=3082771 RepID=UPI000FFE285A|nr:MULTISPECIES: hypothetical protein [Acutalibacteraceae]QAT48629.1 hypothetical protein EQM14_01880 [Caproiciproducens sp. NJN-50]
MGNMKIECYHKIGITILLKIDDDMVEFKDDKKSKSFINLILENGNHEITFTKDSFLNHWYWWLNIFNPIYVLLFLKNVTKGNLGYDDDFASCTVHFTVTNNKDMSLKAELISQEHNKNGKQGDYFKFSNIKGKNVNIKSIKTNRMEKILIKRWRISKGFPIPFYCILTYIALAIKMVNSELASNIPIFIYILFSAIYSVYALISVFKKRSVEENLKGAK